MSVLCAPRKINRCKSCFFFSRFLDLPSDNERDRQQLACRSAVQVSVIVKPIMQSVNKCVVSPGGIALFSISKSPMTQKRYSLLLQSPLLRWCVSCDGDWSHVVEGGPKDLLTVPQVAPPDDGEGHEDRRAFHRQQYLFKSTAANRKS